jgi:hypothetical protein
MTKPLNPPPTRVREATVGGLREAALDADLGGAAAFGIPMLPDLAS